MEINKGVSLVVVTRNGSKRLSPTIEFLAKQRDIYFPFEIILVDNNSTDETTNFVREKWKDLGNPFVLKIFSELQPGTLYARNRGIREAAYRYVLFCDDDNWLNPNYVKTAYNIISRDERISAVGGLGIMKYKKSFIPPEWFLQYEKNYGTGPQGTQDGDTTYIKGCLYSAGAIFDKQWIDRLYSLGFVPTLTGRDGKKLMAGEDTELTFALKAIGGLLHYSSEMWFYHSISPDRINWNYLKKLWRSFGYSDFLISPYHDSINFWNLVKREHRNLKRVFILSIHFFLRKPEEGSAVVLEREKKIGELSAFFLAFKTFNFNRKQVKDLKLQKQGRIE